MNPSNPTPYQRVKTMMSRLLTLFCRQVDWPLSPEAQIPTSIVYLFDFSFVIKTMPEPSRLTSFT
jgi:hypothetical protein